MADIETHTVGEGEDLITYDVRGDLSSATADRPALFAFGNPMDAGAFGTLAGHFTDRPFVTYDPRGAGRNPTGTTPLTPQLHAVDLHAVVSALGGGPVDVFATSGGAVAALAWVAAHPGDVRRVILHEPPITRYLPDREVAVAVIEDVRATYEAAGNGPTMAKFIALVMTSGELTATYLEQPAPDPAQFGMSSDDDGSRTNPLIRNMPGTNDHEVDVSALRPLADRVIVAIGEESGEEMAARGGRSVADVLGLPVTVFPSHHAGFVGDGHGRAGKPAEFAAKLRDVLG